MPRRRKSCIFKQSSVTVFCRQAGLHGEVLVGRGVSSQEAEYPRLYLLPSLSSRLLQCFAGELDRMVKFWLAGACHVKKEKKDKSSHNIGILNFTSAVILLAAGVLLGTTLLLLEHCYFKFGRKCLKKYDKTGCCSLVSLVRSPRNSVPRG